MTGAKRREPKIEITLKVTQGVARLIVEKLVDAKAAAQREVDMWDLHAHDERAGSHVKEHAKGQARAWETEVAKLDEVVRSIRKSAALTEAK